MAPLLGGVLVSAASALIDGVSSWWKHRNEVKREERESELQIKRAETAARIHYIAKKQELDAEWEVRAMDASAYSWKDEWLTLLFSIPLVMCFIPGLRPYVDDGFEALKGTPDWYQWSILVIVAASFGFRKIADAFQTLKGNRSE